MASPWWYVVYVVASCLLGGMIALARRIEWSRRGLDRKEMGVALRAEVTSLVGGPLLLFLLVCCGGGLGALLPPLWCFASYRQRAAVKKVVGLDPREQDRAEGVIFSFYELRITRTELIRGYEKDAPRIPLEGLTAEATKTDTVDISIKGPNTKFVYSIPSMPFEVVSGFKLNLRGARQFAALLNYEAILQNYEATRQGGPNRFGPNPIANQLSEQDGPETRPVTRFKANDGYIKKCLACGKFTRDAKVCRHCGRTL